MAGAKTLGRQDILDKSSLFGCMDDATGCLLGCFCPCMVSAKNKAKIDLDRTCTVFDCILCPSEYFTRRQLRMRFNLLKANDDSAMEDCYKSCCCMPCFICQDSRIIEEMERETTIANNQALDHRNDGKPKLVVANQAM